MQPHSLIASVGHDGSQILWPQHDDPYKRRGFHPQEMTDFAYNLGKRVTTFEAVPSMVGTVCGDPEFELPMDYMSRLSSIMYREQGVLTGYMFGRAHAVAWDRKQIIDNNGMFFPCTKMNIQYFFAVG